tara:strand:- start:926 stop:2071 length:1146 start_codon:yes stop_codon:yes gene_type:complete
MKIFSTRALLVSFFLSCLCLLVVGVSNSYGDPNGVSFAQSRLSAIVAKEKNLFLAANNKQAMNEKELTRKIQDLVSDYESYLADNPKDLTALILYGKFLRCVDQPGPATGVFLKAEKLDPNVAVIKQQIANYLTEEGRIAEALPYLLRAVELSPKEAIYHNQLGSFLFLFREELIRLGITTQATNDRNMMIAFREAAKLASDNFDYRLRYAQSFFDVSDPDWEEALKVWNALSVKGHRSVEKAEYLSLCQARVLAKLGRLKEAKVLINSVRSPVMGATKQKLLDLLEDPASKFPEPPSPTDENKTKKDKNASLKKPVPDDLFFDEDLMNLHEIAQRLEEKKLLRDLRVEAIRATYDEKGKVKMSLRGIAELTRPDGSGRNL